MGEPVHLFKKIDDAQAGVWREKFGGSTSTTAPSEKLSAAGKKALEKAKKAAKKNTQWKSSACPRSTFCRRELTDP